MYFMELNYCCIPIIPINWYLEVEIIVIPIDSLVLVLCLAHRIFWKNTYLMNFLQYRILQLVSSVTFKISFSNWLILFHLFIFSSKNKQYEEEMEEEGFLRERSWIVGKWCRLWRRRTRQRVWRIRDWLGHRESSRRGETEKATPQNSPVSFE